jgi:hypothetical protein
MKKQKNPVLTMSMADEIEECVNKAFKELLIVDGDIPRPIIMGIAIIAISKYTGKPVRLVVE